MSVFLWVTVITLIAGVGGTGLGGLVSALFRRDSSRTVSLLLSFTGGVMLAVVCFDLIGNALAPEGVVTPRALPMVIGGVALGFAVVALLNWWIDRVTNDEVPHIDEAHPQTADDLDELIHHDHFETHKGEKNNKLFTAGLIMAAAIALHNMPEGMVIGSAYAGSAVTDLWTGSGMLLAAVIGLHNIPEGMAVAVPLIAGGMPKWKAICITAASGLPTVLGAMLGYALGSLGATWYALSLSFASGAMLYVVFGELLPESILMWRSKMPALAVIVGLLVGLVIIYV